MIVYSVKGQELLVSIDKVPVLHHSPKHPCLAVGNGRQEVRSRSGFFKIRRTNARKHWLRTITARQEQDSLVIHFSGCICMHLDLRSDNAVIISCSVLTGSWNLIWLRLPAEPSEQIFGCGEQFTHLNLKGRRFPVWISEPGVGRNRSLFSLGAMLVTRHIFKWHHTYFALPSWVSTSGMYAHMDTDSFSIMDFTMQKETIMHAWDIPNSVTIGYAPSLKEAVQNVGSLLGHQPELPEWVYDGMWLGVQGGTSEVKRILNQMLHAGVRIGALWCQDWEGIRMTSFGRQLFWSWTWDDTRYQNLPEFIRELRKQGIRFMGYINAFLTPQGKMYEEARDRGFLVCDAQEKVYEVAVPSDPAVMVDFTNPEAATWMKNIIKEQMLGIGMSGWMADFGEYIPHDAVLHNGMQGLAYHNRCPVDWAKINHDAVHEFGSTSEAVFFMRAGYSGSFQYCPLLWNGDQVVDWSREDGLASAITASLSLSACGAGLVHSDIGGYTTAGYKKRSKELLMRWTEYAAFTPIMRSHEGNRPERNHQLYSDEETMRHVAQMTHVFCRLKPYHQALAQEYAESGVPPMRIPVMECPDDNDLVKYPYQYFYGSDLFVAPVIKKGRKEWKVFLPRGTWFHIWSGRSCEGRVIIPAPLGNPPVFYREGSKWQDLFLEVATIADQQSNS